MRHGFRVAEKIVPRGVDQVGDNGHSHRNHGQRREDPIPGMREPAQSAPGPGAAHPLRPQPGQPEQRDEDDGQLRAGLLTMLPREVVDRSLQDPRPAGANVHQQLGGDRSAIAAQIDPVEEPPVNQLVRAVDIPGADAEEQTTRSGPQPRVDLPQRGIRAPGPVADDRIGPFCHRLSDERRELAGAKLAVGVGKEQAGRVGAVERGRDAGPYRGTVSLVDLMVDDLYPAWVPHRERVGDIPGAVVAAVVDDDHAVPLTDDRQRAEHVLDACFEVGFLTVGRQHDGYAPRSGVGVGVGLDRHRVSSPATGPRNTIRLHTR